MKKTLLLALALVAVGCAEPEPRNLGELVEQGDAYWTRIDTSTVQRVDGIYLDPETMRPYSGPVFEWRYLGVSGWDTTEISLMGNLRDGRWHGPYVAYKNSFAYLGNPTYGNVGFRGTFNMGEPCGEWLDSGARRFDQDDPLPRGRILRIIGDTLVTYDPC